MLSWLIKVANIESLLQMVFTIKCSKENWISAFANSMLPHDVQSIHQILRLFQSFIQIVPELEVFFILYIW